MTSIKSIDLDAKTYQDASKLRGRLNKYVDQVDEFAGHRQEGFILRRVSVFGTLRKHKPCGKTKIDNR